MSYRRSGYQGIVLLIVLLIWGVYSLFHYLFKISIVLGILTLGLLFLGLYYLFKLLQRGNTINIDSRGYERDSYNRLVHRSIAYEHIYKEGYRNGQFTERFGSYDVHHIDQNKRNNSPENLQILTRKEHDAIHKELRKN